MFFFLIVADSKGLLWSFNVAECTWCVYSVSGSINTKPIWLLQFNLQEIVLAVCFAATQEINS